jgi:CubicO group peptidase (beta-lactamase class C family)
MKRLLFFVVAALLVMVRFASANSLSVTKPENVGMSSRRLARIATAMQAEINKGLTPGAVIAISRRGKLVYYESFGYLDKTANTPMPKDAIFSIASMTKPLTAVGALTLYEEDRLLLNDPVGSYLPQLATMRVATDSGTEPARHQPTLIDLMRHTAGLTYGNTNGGELDKAYSALRPGVQTTQEFLDMLSGLPLRYQPGTRWDYGLGLDVLGLIVESVTQQRLGAYLEEKLFKRLGMTDTGFSVPAAKLNRFAKPLPNDPTTGRPQTLPRDPSAPLKFDCGGGCCFSMAADYMAFAEMLRNKGTLGDKHVLGRKTVEFMTADQLGPEVNIDRLRDYPNINGYGFGLSVAVRRETGVAGIMGTPGDFNWGGANGTYFWVDPKEELSVVFMAATPGEIRIHFRQVITTLVLQAIAD